MTPYPHMCQDGHSEIGYRNDEKCPLCRVTAEAALLRDAVMALVEFAGEIVDRGDAMDQHCQELTKRLAEVE